MLTGGKHIMQVAQKYAVTNHSILKNTIAEGVRRGELRPIDVELAPISLMGMVVIFQFLRPFISAALGKTEYDDRFVNRIAAHTIDLFLNGVASDRARLKPSITAAGKKKTRSTKKIAKVQK